MPGRPTRRCISGRGNEICLHFKESRPALEPTSPRIQRVPWLNRPAREAGYSLPYSAEPSAWSCASGPPYSIVLMTCPNDFASAFAFSAARPRCSLYCRRRFPILFLPVHKSFSHQANCLCLGCTHQVGPFPYASRYINAFQPPF